VDARRCQGTAHCHLQKEKHFSEALVLSQELTGEVSTQLSVQIGNCGHSGFAGSDRAPGKPD